MSVSITISNSIQTARGTERDKVKKKIIRMENRIEERSCLPHSLSVWITNNNRGVTSFRVEIKKKKDGAGGKIYLLRYFFLFVIIIIPQCSSNTYNLSRFKTDYFSINWFAAQKAVFPRTSSQSETVLHLFLKIRWWYEQNWIIYYGFTRFCIESMTLTQKRGNMRYSSSKLLNVMRRNICRIKKSSYSILKMEALCSCEMFN